MKFCSLSVALSYLASVHLGSSLYYKIVTHSYGTPFKDSLTEEQNEIMKESSKKRRNAYLTGAGLSVVALLALKPFHKC